MWPGWKIIRLIHIFTAVRATSSGPQMNDEWAEPLQSVRRFGAENVWELRGFNAVSEHCNICWLADYNTSLPLIDLVSYVEDKSPGGCILFWNL